MQEILGRGFVFVSGEKYLRICPAQPTGSAKGRGAPVQHLHPPHAPDPAIGPPNKTSH